MSKFKTLFASALILSFTSLTFSQVLKPAQTQTRPQAPGATGNAAKPKGQQIQIKSETGSTVTRGGKPVFLMKGDCHFYQGNSNMTSDSAYYYSEENRMDAFGHVVIHQADTVTITGDKLYYNGNSRKAQMYDHCVMTDRQGVLTTDHLDYDMATKIGTYYDGGKITNKDNILLSRTGYYYETTKVAYFKRDVTILTPTTTIKSDTLQYNTVSRIAYFFGPTRITSKDDFIYCENGEYNTATDQAKFSRNAYYTSGSKRLQGDSLYYDKRAGFGRAVRRVTFTDSLDNEILKGGLARYNKATEETIITRKPLLIFLTVTDEAQDSARRKDSLLKAELKADSVKKLRVKAKPPAVTRERTPSYAEILAGHSEQLPPGSDGGSEPHAPIPDLSRKKVGVPAKVIRTREKLDSIFLTADTFRTVLVSGDLARPRLAPKFAAKRRVIKTTSPDSLAREAGRLMDKIHNDVRADSIAKKQGLAPSLKTPLSKPGVKNQPSASNELARSDAGQIAPDSTRRTQKPKKRPGFLSRLFGNHNGPSQIAPLVDSTSKAARRIRARKDSLATKAADAEALRNLPDLLADVPFKLKQGYHQVKPSDTAHYRVIFAFHHARLFKADFQAAADSMVYTYVDSTIRCFIRPALWTQGTQMTSDTISIRLKNRKLDSLIMIHGSFIISKVDSLENQNKFNQISGRDIFGKFINNKLNRMRVEGNGKSLFYASEEKKDTVTSIKTSRITGLNSEICSYFLMSFKGNKAKKITAVDEPNGHFYPVAKVPAGHERLPGFLWRDSERPQSRIDLFNKPTIAQVHFDEEVNKRTAADSLGDVNSINILEEPKPKARKTQKKVVQKLGVSPDLPIKPANSAAPAQQQLPPASVPPSDSTLTGNGFIDTIRTKRLKTP